MQDQRPAEHAADPATGATPPLGRYYDVAGRRLMLHRSGTGNPAVVFLAGAGAVGLDYLNVQERAAGLATSVLYDRAGTGWSGRADLPRTAAQVTDELRDLLRAAGVPAPYLLAGHSLGGLYARHYAQRFPGEVSALLLMDPAHEDHRAYMPPEVVDIWNAWDPDQLLPDECRTSSSSSTGACSRRRWRAGRPRSASRSSSVTSARIRCGPACRRPRTSMSSTTRSVAPGRCPTCR